MKGFDEYLKKNAVIARSELPDSVQKRLNATLESLPEPQHRCLRFVSLKMLLACTLIVALVILPNISVAYARVLESIPVLGELIRVVTIRNDVYSDAMHDMAIRVPQIVEMNNEAIASINQEIQTLTDQLLQRFYQDLELIGDQGHTALYADYEVQMNQPNWFTIKIQVNEASGSGNVYYRYYHLDKRTGKEITLADLSDDARFFQVIEEDIKEQMQTAMNQDPQLVYWVDDPTFGDAVSIDGTHAFYWTEEGDLAIPFNKYEVGPGYMGTPTFIVSKEKIAPYLKEAYQQLF